MIAINKYSTIGLIMEDIYDIINNIDNIYNSNTSFEILKDFERVLDELDVYVYKNWEHGELVKGPVIERHWVTCSFMWPRKDMPDPMGGKRLIDYDCKVRYKKDYVIKPRKIREPGDVRPNTKKGKLDRHPIWLVEIQMPKKLIVDIYGGYNDLIDYETEAATEKENIGGVPQPADAFAAPPPVPGAAPPVPPVGTTGAPIGEPTEGGVV